MGIILCSSVSCTGPSRTLGSPLALLGARGQEVRADGLRVELCHVRYQGAVEQRKLPATRPRRPMSSSTSKCAASTKCHASGWLWLGASPMAWLMRANQHPQAPKEDTPGHARRGITSTPCVSMKGRGSCCKPRPCLLSPKQQGPD